MAIYIGHASIDERGRSQNGIEGDQTKKEVCIRTYYMPSKGWYLIRPKNIDHAVKIVKSMECACNNDNIGYDQYNRLGIIKYGTKTTVKTECDCSSLVRQCVIEATGIDPGNFTTADEKQKLLSTGLFENAISVTSSTVLYNGDILVTKTKGHTAIVVSGNPRLSSVDIKSSMSIEDNKKNSNKIIKSGQTHANNFAQCGIIADGIYGNKTKKAAIKVLQRAINLDYKSGLVEDGIWGAKSEAALGKHYVKRNETQYMVTALEILLMLKGYDCNGVELPGKFGGGLEKALKQYQKDKGLSQTGIADANTFKSLIS